MRRSVSPLAGVGAMFVLHPPSLSLEQLDALRSLPLETVAFTYVLTPNKYFASLA